MEGSGGLAKDLLKRFIVVILSNISFECFFARFDSILNLIRFNEPANEYERVLEILVMQSFHFTVFSRLLKVDFSYHLLSLYMLWGGIMRLAYNKWLRRHARVFIYMLWEGMDEVWELLSQMSFRSWFLITMLGIAGAGIILLKI